MKFKITLQLDYASLLIPTVLVLEGRLIYVLAWLLSACIHECGHLFAARWLHIPIHSLHISILGARLQLRDPLLSYRREWCLCAAGPLFSVICSLGAGYMHRLFPNIPLYGYLGDISLALGIINLLPIGWLDGGRMHRAVCYQFLSPAAARTMVLSVSFLCFLLLWMTSVYLLLRYGSSLSLFTFSFSLFLRFFLSDTD